MVKISPIDPNTLVLQTFSSEDSNIIQSTITSSLFNVKTDNVEYFVYDLNDNLLSSNPNYNNWSVIDDPSIASTKDSISTIEIDPVKDLENSGYSFGKVKSVYNFVSPKLTSSTNNRFYISEISSDRTELRLKSNFISNESLQIAYEQFKTEFDSSEYFDEFYLNFGNNQLVLAVNILLDTASSQYSLLIKLYEALPSQFQTKSELYVVTKPAESIGYEVEFETTIDLEEGLIRIKPANLNLDILDQVNNSTPYKNYDTLLSTNSSSSLYQLLNYLSGSGVQLNIDYTNYNNFVNFSSATQRLYNFKQKVLNISSSQAQLNSLNASITGSTSSSLVVSSSRDIIENQIQSVITGFDNYENYLYFQSSSFTWPKQNSTAPYILFDPTSVEATNWYATQSLISSEYDANNQNYLFYSIPSYIRENSENDPYILFTDMIGQLFDEIWVYTKNVTEKLDSNNNLDVGVSKDIVANVLESLGIKLYASNFTAENLYNTLLGLNPDGGNLLPTGSELITSYVTSSVSSSLVPTIDDYNKLIYKKIYHNLPYLLKKKGTVEGLRALINLYGVPSTVLRINEFGGKDKNFNTWDYWQNEFSYAYKSTGSYYISSSFNLNSSWAAPNNVPGAVEFRFKTQPVPPTNYSQSLWITNQGLGVFLEYTGSGLTSGSYSGSVVDSYYQYGTLKFISGTDSASVYLPFFNGEWWSVLVNSGSSGYELISKNSIYSGSDGNTIGFQASSSLNIPTLWSASTISYFASSSGTYIGLSGSLQEIRYYTQPLSEDSFNAYVMNPNSIEQSQYLAFRAALGGELCTGSTSIHPKVTGSWISTSSFTGTSNFHITSTPTYSLNYEINFYDQPAVGIKNVVSEKIKTENILLPTTSSTDTNIPTNKVLSKYISIQQNYPVSSSYTEDINYTEIAFSPQNEINEDIMSTLGYFNIGDYIGDPRLVSSSAEFYPALDALRNLYFEKYSSNYDWNDFIRLIQFFDNSLFKTLKDYVPAKSSLASGVVIKQHLLERNKYPVPQMNFTQSEYTSSIDMYEISGSNGGALNITSIVTQSWTGVIPSVSGSIPFTQTNESEFFDGQFSGSIVTVTNGDLNDCSTELIQVYTTASLPSLNALSSATYLFNGYNFNFEKTYYLSFSIQNIGAASGTLQIRNNTGINVQILYNSPSISAGGTLVVENLEISKAIIPLIFLALGSGSELQITNLSISELYIEPDCLPVEGNVLDNRLNTVYMDVDYTNNSLIPVNQQTLLSGSATRFAIPDSNYTMARSINPRYNGSRTTSPGFNQPIYSSLTTLSTQSQVPNASRYSNYFIYFDYIESSYPEVPNGGNVHGVYLVTTEGQAIPLTGDNNYVSEVSNIFTPGLKANVLPAVYSAGNINPQVTIFDGGAKYQTIVALSGSTVGKATGSLGIYDPTALILSATSDTFFSTGSTRNILDDNVSGTPSSVNYFIDILQYNFNSYSSQSILSPTGYFSIYNKNTKQYVSGSAGGSIVGTVNVLDTLLPIQQFDYIRLGDARISGSGINTINNSSSVDYSFTSMNLITVSTTNNVNSYALSTFINSTVADNILGTSFLNQNYRIFRRIPNETNIVIQSLISFTDPGFLIPENFNPNYNPYDLARKAGIIT